MMSEFVLVWFHSTSRWYAIGEDGRKLATGGSMGEAKSNALKLLNAAEADYNLCEASSSPGGTFYRYCLDEERHPPNGVVTSQLRSED